ncbi:MAG: ribonuclease III [Candidatus Omnitrophica bacterium]|nr:ribonuclease III [Candidatus Omnitrophota bacterium]
MFFRSELSRERLQQLHRLERVLGVRFRRPALLHQALIHRSYRQGAKPGAVQTDNETMEFLGDAVLGLVISEELYLLYPVSEVGELAKVKAQVVSRATLGEIALDLRLDQWILLGQGETARGEGRRPSVIGSALEAVFGAIYLDRGLPAATKLIKRLFREQIEQMESGEGSTDYKSLLQEYVLRYFKASPEYRMVGESGPGHRRRFQVSVGWRGKAYGHGSGPNKKAASQEAARAALEHMLSPVPERRG